MSMLGSRLNAIRLTVVRYGDRLRMKTLAHLSTTKVHQITRMGVMVHRRISPVITSTAQKGYQQRSPRSPRWLERPTRDTAVAAVFLCIAFYVAARIGLALHFPASLVYFVWPPSVLVFVALVLSPRRVWWVYFLALLPVHMVVELGTVAASPTSLMLFYGIVWIQALVGAVCVRRFAGHPFQLDTLRTLIIFLLSGAGAAAVAEAVTLATVLVLTTRGADFWQNFIQTLLADALTMSVLAPALVIAWTSIQRVWSTVGEPAVSAGNLPGSGPARPSNVWSRRADWLRAMPIAQVTEASLLALALLGIGLVALGGYVSLPATLPALLYTVLPLLLWTAVRFGLGGTSLALCGLTLLAIIYAIHGRGPFSTLSTTEDLFSLQLFFIAISVPLLVLAVLMHERQEAQRGLEQSEARYRDLVESQSEMICRYLPDSTLTFVNKAFCRTYEKPREHLVSTKFFDLQDQPARDHHIQHVQALLAHVHTQTATQAPVVDEYEIRLPGGRLRWQQWVDHPICDANGEVVEIQAVGRDITDRKRAEAALQESEARFRAAFESAATGMMLIDTTGRALQVNRPLADMLGYSAAELLTHTFMDITYADDLPANLALFRSGLAGELDTYQFEKRLAHKDGHLVWTFVSAGVVRDATGQPRYVIGQLQDITDRKWSEEALRASEERYRAVVNNFPHGSVLLFGQDAGQDVRHLFADGQGLPGLGLSQVAMVGKTVWEAFPPEIAAALAPRYQAALEGIHAAFDLAHAGHTYQTQVLPIPYAGTTAGMAIMQDVTEQRRAEILAELDRAKTAFFSNVSHELRTPLTLLLGPATDALVDRDEPLPPRQRERVELIRRSAQRLHKLVNTLLDFSRLEAGRTQATYEPTDVGELTAELASTFRSAVERAGLRLVVETVPLSNLPQPAYLDREMWEKIVLNLLSNALKFTFDGAITVSVRTSRQGDEQGNGTDDAGRVSNARDWIELEVRDTGTGIPTEELPHVFERFYRVQGAQARTQDGTGIGLALVQELVRQHGGTVRVVSTLGVGSTFTVAIPIGDAHLPADRVVKVVRLHARDAQRSGPRSRPATVVADEALSWLPAHESAHELVYESEPALAQPRVESSPKPITIPALHAPVRGAGASILVADDNADMRAYLVRLLDEHWEVQAVADGSAALAAARARPPDLVLADVMMPGLDGIALVTALRSHTQTKAIPIILLSARVGEEATVEGLQVGADDYLTKPFSARELLARVQTYLELARVRREAEARAAQLDAIFEAMADGVLVHDLVGRRMYANPAYRDLLRHHLAMRGHEIEPDRLFAAPAAREHYISISDEQGQPISQEEWATERALRGEILTGEHAVDEFTQGTDDTVLQLNVSAAPVRNAGGQITGAVAVFRDVTTRRQLERQVAEQANQLQAIFEAMTDGVFVLDPAGRVTRLNPAARRLFEPISGDEVPMTAEERARVLDLRDGEGRPFAPEQLPTTRLLRGEALAGVTAQTLTLHAHDGEVRTMSLTGAPLRDATISSGDGQIVGAVAVLRDISELKRAQTALAEQERLFRTLVENSPDIIARFDRDQRYLYVNPAITRIAPTPPEHCLGRTNQELGWPEAFYGPARRALEAVFETGQSRTLLEEDVAATRGDSGHARSFRAQILPEFAADGTTVESVLTVTTEITDLKRAEAALRAATASAESAQREEERRRREAERREQIAESLRDVLATLNSNREVTTTLHYIARQAARLLSSDAAAIYTIGADGVHGSKSHTSGLWSMPNGAGNAPGSLTLQAAFGLPSLSSSSRGKHRTAIGDTAVRRTMSTQQPVVVLAPPVTAPEHALVAPTDMARVAGGNDGAAEALEPGRQPEQTEDSVQPEAGYLPVHEEPLPAPYQALLAIPIVAQQQVYGGLLLLYVVPRHFTADEVALAMAYGDQIALAMANAQLQDHIEREAVERERNRLARELHDTVTQEIFTASMLAESIPRVWEQHRAEAETHLQQLHQLTRGALAALRALLLELRPKVLEQKALPELLQQLGEAMTPRAGVPIAVIIEDDSAATLIPGAAATLALPTEVKIAFYRIAQEALMNVAKYAQARTIVVRLSVLKYKSRGGIQLEVRDDGRGFEAGAVPAGHFGLGMMRERAQAVGATLRLTSRPGYGSRVTVKWRSS